MTRFQLWLAAFARRMRILAILIIIVLVCYVGYLVYNFYAGRGLGAPTAERIFQQYFGALAQGNYEEVYRLTAQDSLTDIYGRHITEGEFISQLRKLTGGSTLPFSAIESTRICEQRDVRYYEVKLHSSVGGVAGVSRLIVEIRRADDTWLVTYPFPIILQG